MLAQNIVTAWKPAVRWGLATALLHRIGLTIWMTIAWQFLGSAYASAPTIIHNNTLLPSLDSPLEQYAFGLWRRWDAIHYLLLATKGYQPVVEGSTVFGPLTPLGIWFFDTILPGPLDLGAAVFETLASAIALTLLYRIVETYYADSQLAPWAVVVMAITPLSFYFAAPMSESVYLAAILASFYFATRSRWGWTAAFGFLATLARSPGMLMLPVAGLMLLHQEWRATGSYRQTLLASLRKGWVLAFIPLAFFGFEVYRSAMNLTPISEIYRTVTQNRFVNPIEGLILNLEVLVRYLHEGTYNLNPPWLVATLILTIALFFYPKHRRIALLAYTLGHLTLFLSVINYVWYTDIIMGTQSIARYTLVLFPIAVFLADRIRHLPKLLRAALAGGLVLGLLLCSALFTVALVGP